MFQIPQKEQMDRSDYWKWWIFMDWNNEIGIHFILEKDGATVKLFV